MKSFAQFVREQTDFTGYMVEDEVINPKAFDLSKLYDELNQTLFRGELRPATKIPKNQVIGLEGRKEWPETVTTDITVNWGSTGSKNSAGITTAWRNKITKAVNQRTIGITIRPFTYTHDKLVGILAHEMIHAWVNQSNLYDREEHGSHFNTKLREVQNHTTITIPPGEGYESVEGEFCAAKRVGFIVMQDHGMNYVQLFTPNLRQDMALRLVEFVRWAHSAYPAGWVAAGIGTTEWARKLPVNRMSGSRARFRLVSLKPGYDVTKNITPESISIALGNTIPTPFQVTSS